MHGDLGVRVLRRRRFGVLFACIVSGQRRRSLVGSPSLGRWSELLKGIRSQRVETMRFSKFFNDAVFLAQGSSKRSAPRRLRVEGLERRELLAADNFFVSPT